MATVRRYGIHAHSAMLTLVTALGVIGLCAVQRNLSSVTYWTVGGVGGSLQLLEESRGHCALMLCITSRIYHPGMWRRS